MELYLGAGFALGLLNLFIPFREQEILWERREEIWGCRGPEDDKELEDLGLVFPDYLRHLDPGVII